MPTMFTPQMAFVNAAKARTKIARKGENMIYVTML